MSLDLYNQSCKLSDQDAIDFTRKAILFDNCNVNKLIRHHCEKLNHFTAKAIMFYLLRDLNHDIVTEFEIVGVGKGDLLDLTTNTQYEFEGNYRKNFNTEIKAKYINSGIELIIVNIDKLPRDINERYRALQQYIIPD